MVSKKVQNIINQTIKEIWLKNIPKDFNDGYIVNEDCLKMSLCYHLRRKLATILKENNLRIYTEKYFPNIKKKPDIIIAEMREAYTENSLYESIREEDVVALFELKFKSDSSQSTADWMKNDLRKMKVYVQNSKLQCPLYFAVIYEVECVWLHWMDGRSTKNWAADRITELDAGRIDGRMKYEVHSY
ncbi:MAG: hypothetical protein J1E98_12110 [Lachnospiraceae bacterium]|nr:hypothetical protein [Lachnospiraceae bacterium]